MVSSERSTACLGHTAYEPVSVRPFCENLVKCGGGMREEGSAMLGHFLAGRVKKFTGKEGMADPLAAWATPGLWVPRFAVQLPSNLMPAGVERSKVLTGPPGYKAGSWVCSGSGYPKSN